MTLRPSFVRTIFLALISVLYASWAVAADADASATSAAGVGQPASQPASEIALVKVGRSVITQEDFNHRTINEKPEQIKRHKSTILKKMIGERMLLLYVQDHPGLVDESRIEAAIDEVIQKEGVNNREELEAKLKREDRLSNFYSYLDMKRILFGRAGLLRLGEKRAGDDNVLKEVFEKNPQDFDGTRMRVRQILVMSNPWDSQEEIKAKQHKLARMRQDILAGRRTWEECVAESDDLGTRVTGGDIGLIPRHPSRLEALAKVAFETKPGEISEVFETPMGYQILQVTDKHQGQLKYEEAKTWVKMYVMQEAVLEADAKARTLYPVVGIREPDMPPERPAATQPTMADSPSGASSPGHATAATKPASVPSSDQPTVGKAGGKRSTSRPAASPVPRPSKANR